MKYIKENGISIEAADMVYLNKDTGYATNEHRSGFDFLGYAAKASGKRQKYVFILGNQIEEKPPFFDRLCRAGIDFAKEVPTVNDRMMMNRSSRLFGEMLQKAKEGKNVVYASMLGNFKVTYIDEEHTKPIMILDDLQKATEQMQEFGFKPGEGTKRELTYFEAFQALAKERKKMCDEIIKHKRSFFDFAVGIIIGTAVGGYFICFLGR